MNRNQLFPDIVKRDILFEKKDMEAMSNEEIAAILLDIIDRELENEYSNALLVEECTRLLEELTPSDIKLSEYELAENLKTLEAKQTVMPKNGKRYRRMRLSKVIPLVAVLVLTLCLSLNVIAIQQGYKNAWDYVVQKAEYLFHLSSGTTVKEGEIAFSKAGEIKTYSDISALLKQEGLPLMYPGLLPEDIVITEVKLVLRDNGGETVYFVFNNKNYNFMVNSPRTIDSEFLSSYPVFECNGKTYYLLEKPERFEAICHYGEFEYKISAPDSEQLLNIIENLEESN